MCVCVMPRMCVGAEADAGRCAWEREPHAPLAARNALISHTYPVGRMRQRCSIAVTVTAWGQVCKVLKQMPRQVVRLLDRQTHTDGAAAARQDTPPDTRTCVCVCGVRQMSRLLDAKTLRRMLKYAYVC